MGCPACDQKTIIGFGVNHLADDFDSAIERVEMIGETQLYKCKLCQSTFFILGDFYYKLFDDQMETLRQFSASDLALTTKQATVLDAIGLTKVSPNSLLAPAKVIDQYGEIFEFAIIQVSNNPPIGYKARSYAKIIFIDDIESIEPSEFAISKVGRDKVMNAKEARMGFYPTLFVAKSGKKVVVNGQSFFFRNESIKGSDLLPIGEYWNHQNRYTYEGEGGIKNKVLVVAKPSARQGSKSMIESIR